MNLKDQGIFSFNRNLCVSVFACGFVCLLPLTGFSQVGTDNSFKSVSPLTTESLPKVKPTDPFVAHSHHSFYFKDTMAGVLLKYTASPDFNAQDPVCLNDLGYIYYYFGEYADAAIQFKKALDLNPAFADAYVNLGVTAYKTGDDDLAQQYLNKAYQMDSSRGEAAYDLGLLAFEKNDFSRAAGFFEEASQTLSQDPKVWNNLGCAYFQQKNYTQAYQDFKAAVDKGAAFYHAYYNLAVASVLSGNYEGAVEDTQKAVELAPSNADANNLLGLAYLFNQNYLKASVSLARAIELDSRNAGYFNNLGRAQLGLGHTKEAEKALKQALLYQPDLQPALWNMGDLKLRQGKYGEALQFYVNVGDWEAAKESGVFQYNWGVAYYKTGDKENARLLWEKARGMDSQYMEPLYGLAVLYEDQKDYGKAADLLRQGQVLEPQSSRWTRLEGDLDMAQGKSQEALAAYEKAKEMGQKDADLFAHIQQLKNANEAPVSATAAQPEETSDEAGFHSQILHLEDMGNLDEASALAKKAADQWGSKPEAWEDLSDVYLKMDQKQQALEAMERAQRISPQDGHYLEECGHIAYLNDKFEIAEHYFGEAAQTSSATWQTLLGMGSCYFRQNLFTEAIAYWEKGAAAYPKQPEFDYNLGRAHYQNGEFPQATYYYKKALELKPNYPEALNNLAALELDQDDLAAAQQNLRKSMALDPQLAETYFNLGNLEMKTDRFDDAMKYYQLGLQINPDDAQGYYCQGVACLQQGQWVKAETFLEKTLEKDPTHADALYNMGKVAIEMNDYSTARKYFEESLKYKPGQDDAYFGIGLVYYHQQQYKDAQLYFVKAQSSFKVADEAAFYLGQTEEKMGDAESAEAFYRQSIQLKPSFGMPHLALGDLLKNKGQLMEARMEYQKAAIQQEYPEVAKVAEDRLAQLQ